MPSFLPRNVSWSRPRLATPQRQNCVGTRIDSDILVARALKNSQLTCGERHAISRTGHLVSPVSFNPIPAPSPLHPVPRDPLRIVTWIADIVAGDPDIVSAIPAPVARIPDI